MPEPDIGALLLRLDQTGDSATAAAANEIFDRIGDQLPKVDRVADRLREVLELARGIVVLRVSDARPSADPAVAARAAAQYVAAMLWTFPAAEREHALQLYMRASEDVFASVRLNGASVDGTIYYLRDNRGEAIKIGYATDLKARLAALATGAPFGNELLASEPGTLTDEAALHLRFSHLRISSSGEWFRVGEDLLAHIDEVQKRNGSLDTQL